MEVKWTKYVTYIDFQGGPKFQSGVLPKRVSLNLYPRYQSKTFFSLDTTVHWNSWLRWNTTDFIAVMKIVSGITIITQRCPSITVGTAGILNILKGKYNWHPGENTIDHLLYCKIHVLPPSAYGHRRWWWFDFPGPRKKLVSTWILPNRTLQITSTQVHQMQNFSTELLVYCIHNGALVLYQDYQHLHMAKHAYILYKARYT